MMPRPTSRKTPLEMVPVKKLADRIWHIRHEGGEPAAVITGPREWRAIRIQVEAAKHVEVWPGDDHTFDKVPVIIKTGLGTPRVMETQAELEDELLA